MVDDTSIDAEKLQRACHALDQNEKLERIQVDRIRRGDLSSPTQDERRLKEKTITEAVEGMIEADPKLAAQQRSIPPHRKPGDFNDRRQGRIYGQAYRALRQLCFPKIS